MTLYKPALNCRRISSPPHAHKSAAYSPRKHMSRRRVVVHAAAQPATLYGLLGVHPTANKDEVRRAYIQAMKDYHPDLSGDDDDDEAHQFAAFINHAYEVLTDPEERALYDAMAGISQTNPFYDDPNVPYDRLFVDEHKCIGCGYCNAVCPFSFHMKDDYYGRAVATDGPIRDDDFEHVQEAMDTCPVNCIHWVTKPQLNYLKRATEELEQIDSFIILSNMRGTTRSVFKEASDMWERERMHAWSLTSELHNTEADWKKEDYLAHWMKYKNENRKHQQRLLLP